MANLSKVIYINEEDYSTLVNGGTITKSGQTYSYDESALYVIKDVSAPEYAETAGYATTAGTATVAVLDGSGNNIAATYLKKPLIIEVNESDDGTNLEQGTYDSITQALALNKQIILKVICDDNTIVYLPLVGNYDNSYEFGAIELRTSFKGYIEDSNYFEFTIRTISDDSLVVHKSGSETITGNKTFSGTVALGSSATATTLATTDNDISVATTAFVHNVVNSISIDSITNPEIDTIWDGIMATFISFTLNESSYQAIEGMTWELWISSTYNTSVFTITPYENYILGPSGDEICDSNNNIVKPSDLIINSESYRD